MAAAEYGHELTKAAKQLLVGLANAEIRHGLIELFGIDTTVDDLSAAKAVHQRGRLVGIGGSGNDGTGAAAESSETCAAILRESSAQTALELATTVDTAWAGIGSVGVPGGSSKQLLAAMHLTVEERALARAANPAGDVCGRFFDDEGVPLSAPTANRVIGVSFDAQRPVPTVIGLAGGVAKARGVLAALRSGVIDIAVFAAELAAEVLGRHTSGTRTSRPS